MRESGPAGRGQPAPRRALRRVLVRGLALGTALVLGAGLLPAAPAQALDGVSDAPAKQAQAAADEARARVDALLDRYRQAAAQTDVALAGLTAAFQAATAADVTSGAAVASERRARAQQTAQIRAVYAAGGPLSLGASVLGASSADDALWRVSTVDRALAGLFADTAGTVAIQARQARLTRARAQQADAATMAQAQALDVLQQKTAVADQALAQAEQTLADLDTRARTARAALASARAIEVARRQAEQARRRAMGTVSALSIPAEYQLAYQQAAQTCPGMSWTLLAGVGQVESGHGRNNGPSSAGAIGPMQFMPATFAVYAVDGDHDDTLDAWDPQDAIFTAAHYLCVSGADGGSAAGIHAALLAYNHAEWYVDLVLAAQQAIIAAQAELAAAQ